MQLFIPGPISIPQEITAAMSRDLIGHRGKEFAELFKECSAGLQKVFYTKNRTLISTSSGTGLMEAALRNCVSDSVLVASCGAFGKKWADIAKACGKNVDVLNIPAGSGVTPAVLESALRKKKYDAVCVTHNETSTGVMNNLAALAQVIKKSGALFLVDAISSAGGAKIEVDTIGIDVCLTSSQKCFSLPPGLSFATVSEAALAKSKTVSGKGYYFDFIELAKEYDAGQTPYTPAVSLLFGLKKVLELIEKEGIEERFKRHGALAQQCQEWAVKEGFTLFADTEVRSTTVTCISNTRGINLEALKKNVKARGYVMDAGYRKLNDELLAQGKKDTFRIPHMGELRKEEFQKYLDCLSEEIKKL